MDSLLSVLDIQNDISVTCPAVFAANEEKIAQVC